MDDRDDPTDSIKGHRDHQNAHVLYGLHGLYCTFSSATAWAALKAQSMRVVTPHEYMIGSLDSELNDTYELQYELLIYHMSSSAISVPPTNPCALSGDRYNGTLGASRTAAI
jgi:hypothetical protein